VEQVELDLERDRFLSAEAAVEYGMIDKVLERRTEIPKAKPR
jgi:ATP-dependent Clp protease protease subunit